MGGTDGTGQQFAAAPSETGNPDGETGSAGGAAGGRALSEETLADMAAELAGMTEDEAEDVFAAMILDENDKKTLAAAYIQTKEAAGLTGMQG